MADADAQPGLDEEQFQALVRSAIEDAVAYSEDDLAPDREQATKYFQGDPFGDEVAGRSQVVSRDVGDTVYAVLPSLMRIFFQGDSPVVFAPVGPEDVEWAQQATDYVQHRLRQESSPTLFYGVFKDALIRRTGVVKFWADQETRFETSTLSAVPESVLAALEGDPDVEVVDLTPEPYRAPLDPEMPMPEATYGVVLRRKTKKNILRLEAVPPEERLISRNARSMHSADLYGQKRVVPISDLVALGYDYDDLVTRSEGTSASDEWTNSEKLLRNPHLKPFETAEQDPSQRQVTYCEVYLRVDLDGDGIAELNRVCTLGEEYDVLSVEPWDDLPFAEFCVDPEPHTATGRSLADRLLDVQRVKSQLMRGALDSLSQSIYPRTGVVEGQVNIDDVLNNEVGAIIRMRAPGMVQPFATPYLGKEALPVLAYWDEVKEARSGISKASVGLDPDSLQSSTRAAVAATISAAQAQVELFARMLAEGMRELFRGVLRVLVKHPDIPGMVRLRGRWTQVDPTRWDAEMDAIVEAGLGRGTDEEKLGYLTQIAEKQENILMTLGQDNPLVGLDNYYVTLSQMVSLAGFKDPSRFFRDPAQQPQQAQQQPKQGQSDPLALAAQVEQFKAETERAAKEAELALKREEMMRKDDLERDRLDADIILRAAELQAKYQTTVDVAAIKGAVDRDRERERLAAQATMQQQSPAGNQATGE